MPAKIKYNNNVIASVAPGQIATVKMKGSLPQNDIEIDLTQISGGSSEAVLQEKTITENGEYTPDEGYDGFSKVTANVPERYEEGVADGKQAEHDAFWDVYQQNGSTDYGVGVRGIFNGKRFTAANFFPKYDIKPIGDAQYLFYAWETETNPGHTKLNLKQRLADCGVVLDTSQTTDITRMFSYAREIDNIPTIDCTGLTTASANVFSSCYASVIEKLIVNETVSYGSWFSPCRNLVEIRFEGVIGKNISLSDSSKLSAQSVQSIIDCLKDLTGGTAQTLTFHADVGAKLTDEQKAAITAKNWTLVY